ncbi:hypothetical protein EN866_33180 [Mesorhizobium sp. M2D.F.Ca.ET.223.01.1.1]|uniref:hypothetical protein n=1 Tax=Mesorhizobium sp. M2D.F.Ca.ET.223.01.1.1 TaxID=2563940 RepID=UPI001091D4B6|nr:hypothetical protein [Mesorhizobium sp. M2D.F.Ca.ET.223.01.1.1]TGR84565.1 hypothetical protein EN866_33180 [Mesorhizobium sp. M2D.F.Ca.ET.223.01.1.1]TGT65975.1 hypothetical protein EN802_30680 [bacterium M00.F.Ca.ET.159.01.1.1]TGT79660.1 hypothetical protein EN800_30020 [bacterium M00.F.Ca.ET.157.01.1.1]
MPTRTLNDLAIKPSLDGNATTLLTHADLMLEVADFFVLAEEWFQEHSDRKFWFCTVSRSAYDWLRAAKIAAPEADRRGRGNRDRMVHLVVRRPDDTVPLAAEFHPGMFIRAVSYYATRHPLPKTGDDDVAQMLWDTFGPPKPGWPGMAEW